MFLVGAGPGAADLVTLRAARLLAAAVVVVHDGLVGDDVLALIHPDARRISVAKQRSRHSVAQTAINDMLIDEARAGHDVIRLKGGDPFIFGRGGEEIEACRTAGVPVEVVPGITAAMGCAAEAVLPLTHRDAASAVSFVAGQCKGLREQDWSGLAGPGRTLVIYMGLASAAEITDKLTADGVAADTPVAVLEQGTRNTCRALYAQLNQLAATIADKKVQSPALIIVGDVVRRSDGAQGAMPQPNDMETQP